MEAVLIRLLDDERQERKVVESRCERLEKENLTMKATITRLELMMAEISKKLQDKE